MVRCHIQNWKGTAQDPLVSHLWSLSIEEQFYLAWPFIVFVLPRRYLSIVCFCLAGAAFVLRVVLLQSGYGGAIYQGTFTRMDGLVLGSAAAIAFRDRAALGTWLRISKPVILLCCCALAAIVIHQRSFDFLLDMTIWGESLLAILFSLVILRTAVNPPMLSVANRWLVSRNAPMGCMCFMSSQTGL
ncbi:MAG: acyltransferase 3 [Bryobacterales bacterium]|nr:acyltransferase 3 [Bryobacterales bacterium]